MREQLNTSTPKGKRKRSNRDVSCTPGLEDDEFMDELQDDEGELLSLTDLSIYFQACTIRCLIEFAELFSFLSNLHFWNFPLFIKMDTPFKELRKKLKRRIRVEKIDLLQFQLRDVLLQL